MTVQAKICGVNTAAAMEAAIAGGATFVGLMFVQKSPRFVATPDAAKLAARAESTQRVGVFVDPSDAQLERVLAQVPIELIQLHGAEPPQRVETIRTRTGRPVMKALAIATADDVAAAKAYEDVADWLLFDAKPPTSTALPGGNATAFDWKLLYGSTWRKPWMLSGGLTDANVAQAVKATGATTVDVSSGVEDGPAKKSPERIAAFLKAVNAL
ncbi:MAG: phosphoribosylanthranilate isomerase [Alphaproteobacteria bacterium]|nr:phosphoribosylanthranilate isomerase [Alphaproteobacteria bacterium]